MPKSLLDHPKVLVFPPVILAATIALGGALQWLLLIDVLATIRLAWRGPFGAAVILTGINVSPLRPTTALATEGIYNWTRNPLYTGGTLVMLGVALIFALDWLVLLIVPSAFILHFSVVRPEEQYLERKFGDQYRQYKLQVPRYGLRI